MINFIKLMPMAGKGIRFKKLNYSNPKPLINVNKKPMFIYASKSMPKEGKTIYIYNQNELKKDFLKKILKKNNIFNYKLFGLKRITKGQANTCLRVKELVNQKDPIFIHSCDSLINYDYKKFINLINKNDIVIFTTSPNKIHLNKPKSYGWIKKYSNNKLKITCKKAASKTPEKDRVIVGTFAFKNKTILFRCINYVVKNKILINNEYYLDIVVREALNLKYKVVQLETINYHSFGTPEELENYKKSK